MKKLLQKLYPYVTRINRFFRIRSILRKNKEYVVVWIYPHIGDAFYALPYISQFKKIHNVKICLIGNGKYQFLYDLFDGIDKFIFYSERDIFGFCYAHIGPLTRKMLFKNIKNVKYISNDTNLMEKFYPNHGCKTLQAFTKKYMYGLSDEVEILYPEAKAERLNKKPYIIISPYANTVKKMPSDVFTRLIKELSKRYIIYTNVGKGQEKLEGTLELSCGILELANYVAGAEAFIGLRSGICDLIGAMTKTKMFVFFNGYKSRGFASVMDYRKDHDSVVEFYDDDYESYLKTIFTNLK